MLKRITIKEVARETNVSEWAVRKNVVDLLSLLQREDRVKVLEYMRYCKQLKNRRVQAEEPSEKALPVGDDKVKVLILSELPANPSAAKSTEFLGVTDDEMIEACKQYEQRMKAATAPYETDPHEAFRSPRPHEIFGLKRDLIIEVAKEVSARNLEWIAERVDKGDPMALLGKLHKAPRDKPAWVLRLLRRHGFERVELVVWVAADMFLAKWVEKFGRDELGKVLARFRG